MALLRFTFGFFHSTSRAVRAALALLGVCTLTVGARADAVTDWNVIAINTIPPGVAGPPQARILGYVHAAVFDAVNAVERKYTVYAVDVKAPDASVEVAAAGAAHGMLTRIFPAQKEPLDAALANSLKAIPAGPGKTEGLAVGNSVAEHLYAASLNDNANATTPAYVPGQSASAWRPYPETQEPRGLTWGGIKPFMLKTADQFSTPGPLPVKSSEYAKEVEEVRVLGAANSSQRNGEQTAVAIFWTVSMPTIMNDIARKAAAKKGNDLAANARLFALLNMAMSDASVATWQLKFEHKLLRPVIAIRNAPALENPGIQHDPNWEPLLVTPGHPDYPSGHCAAAGATVAILQKFFETDVADASYTYPSSGVTRKWKTYSALAKEVGDARVWGGIHTRTADDHADALGRQVAEYQFANFLRPVR
jgi:PAP2 superfamily